MIFLLSSIKKLLGEGWIDKMHYLQMIDWVKSIHKLPNI